MATGSRWSPPAARRWSRIRSETRNGVTVIRFFPRNVYWNFARQGQPPYRRLLWHLRDAWNRDAGRRFRAILDDAPPDVMHTHLIDGFSAAIWRTRTPGRRADRPYRARLPSALPARFLADAGLADLPPPGRCLPALSRLAFAYRRATSICSSARRSFLLRSARAAGLAAAADARWCATAFRCRAVAARRSADARSDGSCC